MNTSKLKLLFAGVALTFMALVHNAQGADSVIRCEFQIKHLRCPASLSEEQKTVQDLKKCALGLWNMAHKDKSNQLTNWEQIKLEGPADFTGQSSSGNIIYDDNAALLKAISSKPLVWVSKLEEIPHNADVSQQNTISH